MAEYHVGCGAFGIYAGTLNKNKTMWQNKSDCTKEAVPAVAQYLMQEEKCFEFDYHGERFVLRVEKISEDEPQNDEVIQ